MTTPQPDAWLATARNRLRAAIPLRWARSYDRAWLSADMVAGVTTWGVMTPTAMACAELAGLRPGHGRYAPTLIHRGKPGFAGGAPGSARE